MYAQDQTGHLTDSIETLAGTVAQCDDSGGSLACNFGRPSYAPDGQTIVVSRQVPIAGAFDRGDQGALMLVGSGGSGQRVLPRQTVDDEEPAFLAQNQVLSAFQASYNAQTGGSTAPPGQLRLR